MSRCPAKKSGTLHIAHSSASRSASLFLWRDGRRPGKETFSRPRRPDAGTAVSASYKNVLVSDGESRKTERRVTSPVIGRFCANRLPPLSSLFGRQIQIKIGEHSGPEMPADEPRRF